MTQLNKINTVIFHILHKQVINEGKLKFSKRVQNKDFKE